jgi:serine/threonine protein phosphatase PrpC
MILKTTTSERQHLQQMPHLKKNHHSHRIHPAKRRQLLALTPFTYTHRSIANERHPHRNEDRILVDELTGLVAVFDGVGGSAAGEIASQTAARATLQAWKRILRQQQGYHSPQNAFGPYIQLDLCTILQELILEADEQVRTEGAARAGTDDLATTVALAAFTWDPDKHTHTLIHAHVGDSRIYLLSEQEKIQRLTSDDGLLAKLIENQIINEFEAFRIDQATHVKQLSDIEYNYFRLRGGITQALGGPLPPTIHINKTTVQPGDRILLCTDGIHDNLIDSEIEAILRNTPRKTAARQLIDQSLIRSHQDHTMTIRAKPDDMSAIVVTCRF